MDCGDPGCVAAQPTDDASVLTGLGWSQIEGLWWCPLHAFGETRRLKKQKAELEWYDGMILLRHRAIEQAEADRYRLTVAAKRKMLSRQDPEVKREVKRLEARVERWETEIRSLEFNKQTAIKRQQRQNLRYRPSIKNLDEFNPLTDYLRREQAFRDGADTEEGV
jgi:hypothetical protein